VKASLVLNREYMLYIFKQSMHDTADLSIAFKKNLQVQTIL